MPDGIGETTITQLENLRDHLAATNPGKKVNIYPRVSVEQLSSEKELEFDGILNESQYSVHYESERTEFERLPGLMDILDFIGHRPLKDQVYMICNLLTVSGFTQAEIADTLGIAHKTYRNALLTIRKDFRERDTTP